VKSKRFGRIRHKRDYNKYLRCSIKISCVGGNVSLDSSGSGLSYMEASSEHSSEFSGSTKGRGNFE
jgi:hypothetical protein